jgi:hypothetical protein
MAGEKSLTTRQGTVAAAGFGLVVLLVVGVVWWSRPPQMGADPEVARVVDALFTAVTARDEKLLGDCEQRLRALKDSGRLPGGAWDYLDGVIEKARAGRWESAAEGLYGFMRAQRREGAEGEHPRKKGK